MLRHCPKLVQESLKLEFLFIWVHLSPFVLTFLESGINWFLVPCFVHFMESGSRKWKTSIVLCLNGY